MVKNLVEQYRIRRGVSKSHLARQLGKCPSYVNRLEKQLIEPSAEMMFRIASYFKCRIEDVFIHRPEAARR
jgi:DNA-binding XRE family transcriptional regulator